MDKVQAQQKMNAPVTNGAQAIGPAGHLDEIATRIHQTCNTMDFTIQNLVNLGDRIFGPSPSDLRDSVTGNAGIDTTPSIDKIFVALGRLDTMVRDLEVSATRLYGLA